MPTPSSSSEPAAKVTAEIQRIELVKSDANGKPIEKLVYDQDGNLLERVVYGTD